MVFSYQDVLLNGSICLDLIKESVFDHLGHQSMYGFDSSFWTVKNNFEKEDQFIQQSFVINHDALEKAQAKLCYSIFLHWNRGEVAKPLL